MSRLTNNLSTIKHALLNAVSALEWHRKKLIEHGECVSGHPDDALMSSMIAHAHAAIDDIMNNQSPTPEDAFNIGAGEFFEDGIYFIHSFLESERLAFEAWLDGMGIEFDVVEWDVDTLDYVDIGEDEDFDEVKMIQYLWASWRDRAFLAGE